MSRHSEAADPPLWEVAHDVLSGRSTVRIQDGSDQRIDDTTLVRREYTMTASVDPADPAGASARGRHVSRITRPTVVFEGSSDVSIQASSTHFHVAIDLELRVNETLHHSKRWVESVPRVLL